MDDHIQRPADATIWAAIESKNFKQALKALDKRLAKKPTDTYLKALKLYIQAHAAMSTGKEFSESPSVLAELLTALKDPANFLEADEVMLLMQDVLDVIVCRDQPKFWAEEMGCLRWETVKSRPKDVELGINNFSVCLTKGDLKHAQMARIVLLYFKLVMAYLIANSLEKNFPKEHRFVFWNITTHYLISKSRHAAPNDKKFSDKMAKAMIKKLADASKEARDTRSLPPRAIHTPQESLLLHRLLAGCEGSTVEERLKYYGNEYLGPESRISKNTWKLWIDKLTLLREAGRWDDLYKLSNTLLCHARKDDSGQILEARGGDWLVWQTFMESAKHVHIGERIYKEVLLEVKAHLDTDSGIDKVGRRNASLAEVYNAFDYLASTPEHYHTTKESLSHSNGEEEGDDKKEPKSFQALYVELIINNWKTVWQNKTSAMFLTPNGHFAFPKQDLLVLLKYLDNNCEIYSTFDDIRLFVERLTPDDRREFLVRLAKNGKFGIAVLPFESSNQQGDKLCKAEHNLLTSGEITACLHRYKLRYLITNSLSESDRMKAPKRANGSSSNPKEFTCTWCGNACGIWCQFCLETQARLSILTYGSAIDDNGRITATLLPTDTHPADDFCILAAMCLVKLAGNMPWREETCSVPLDGTRRAHLLRATVLLEYAWSHSKSNSKISLLLVRLYSQLGCGSLAMRAYRRLGLKQIQFVTLAYTLFDRISSLHPHPFGHLQDDDSQSRSPMEHLKIHQKVHRNFKVQISKNVMSSIVRQNNYDAAVDIVEATHHIKSFQAAVMTATESRKISRIIDQESSLDLESHGFDLISDRDQMDMNFTDSFDTAPFPNFECKNQPLFVQYTGFAPGLGILRCSWNLYSERVAFQLDPKASAEARDINRDWFINIYSRNKDKIRGCLQELLASKEVTKIEKLAYSIYAELAEILLLTNPKYTTVMSPEKTRLETDLEGSVGRLQISILKMISHVKQVKKGNTVPGFASTLHPLYLAHEVSKVLLNFDKIKASTGFPAKFDMAMSESRRLMNEVVKASEAIRRSMDESGWIDKVLDSLLEGDVDETEGADEPSTLAGALKAVISADFMESWAGEVVESWRDSVVGLACLKGW